MDTRPCGAVKGLRVGRSDTRETAGGQAGGRGVDHGDPAPPLAPGRRHGPAPAPLRRPAAGGHLDTPLQGSGTGMATSGSIIPGITRWSTSTAGRSSCSARRPRTSSRLWLDRDRGILFRVGGSLGLAIPRYWAPAFCARPVPKVKPRITGRRPGLKYTRHSYRVAVQRACKRAGIEPWSPRQLRHTRATAIRKAFGLEAAKAVLGHLVRRSPRSPGRRGPGAGDAGHGRNGMISKRHLNPGNGHRQKSATFVLAPT